MTTKKLKFRSKPLLYVVGEDVKTHKATIDGYSIRESLKAISDSTLPNGTKEYTITIEAEVTSQAELKIKTNRVYDIAEGLNRIWAYASDFPFNAPHLGLYVKEAPDGWSTNANNIRNEFVLESSGLEMKLEIKPRHWLYCESLPLSRALDAIKKYENCPQVIKAVIELHYQGLVSEDVDSRFVFYAKALEIVRALLEGKNDKEKQNSLPNSIIEELDQSLHWLFGASNNRFNIRHVVKNKEQKELHQKLSSEESKQFEHDSDLIIRAVVCENFGLDPIIIKQGSP